MGTFFADEHEWPSSQLGHEKETVGDTEEIRSLRAATDVESRLKLAKALVYQLRYRSAVAVLDSILAEDPDNQKALRMRGIRRVYTLDTKGGREDFLRLKSLGWEEDLSYQVGLSWYFEGNYKETIPLMVASWRVSTDEMKVAAAYWEALAALRLGKESELLKLYRKGMEIGHHKAYDAALQFLKGEMKEQEYWWHLDAADDLDYAILGYAYYVWLETNGWDDAREYLEAVVERDGFWIGFAYVGAWNDHERRRTQWNA